MKKRILFVDDEPNVLQGLQRVLVADGLAYEQHLMETSAPRIVIDTDYLMKLGLADRLPVWREQSQTLF